MRYLGIDYGLKRIGLAISEGELATPWKVLEINGLADALQKIESLVRSEKIDKAVIGMPEGRFGKAVKRFVDGFKKTGIEIETSDETLSTKNATRLMIEMGLPQKKRQTNDDYSAAAILQEYLDDTNGK